MHGAEAELVEISFADAERLPSNDLAGEPIFLRYMPTALLVRVRDAKWKLPDRMLPAQYANGDNEHKQGLCMLLPQEKYFRFELDGTERA